MQHFGDNVQYSLKGDVLTLVIDLAHRGPRSASGKTTRVASTQGNKVIPGTEVALGLNAYVKGD
jgi:hypothetical protein